MSLPGSPNRRENSICNLGKRKDWGVILNDGFTKYQLGGRVKGAQRGGRLVGKKGDRWFVLSKAGDLLIKGTRRD